METDYFDDDGQYRKYSSRISLRQKKKLIDFLSKHPELISGKPTQDYNYKHYRKLWHRFSIECNSLPGGARKTWQQWRKTWHDMHSKAKKRQSLIDGERCTTLPSADVVLTPAEHEALAKNVSSTTNYQETTEFVIIQPAEANPLEVINDVETATAFSEPRSPPELKVFHQPKEQKVKPKSTPAHESTCNFNCDLLAASEQKKLEMKEDFNNFRKEYLNKKLKLMEDHNEALRSIAKELSNLTTAGTSSSGSMVTLKLPNLIKPKTIIPVVTRTFEAGESDK